MVIKMIDARKDCPMRHENGNCLVCGGFCLAVSNALCEALHNAYNKGCRDNESYKLWDMPPMGGIHDD